MQEPLPDRDLIQMIQSSESAQYGFYLLISKYQKVLYIQVFRLVLDRDDTEDILQDVFTKVFEKRNSLTEINQLPSWLMTLALNQALMFLRKKKRQALFRLTNYSWELQKGITTHYSLSGDEIEEKFLKAQVTLTDRQRAVFNLRYYDEMKFADIAPLLGITEGACKATYHNAAKKIEKSLTD